MSGERKWPRAIARLLDGLDDPDGAGALVDLAFDFAIDQPLTRYLDPERVLGHLERALQPSVMERIVRAHLRPWLDRERDRAHARGDRVGDWLTAEAIAELRALAARPVELKRSAVESVVRQEAVRDMLRGIIEEALDRFVDTLRPGGSGGGLVGAVGRGAFGLAGSVGKGLFGGISSQVEGQLRRAVTTFLEGSMNALLDRVVAMLSSRETAEQLGRMKLSGFDRALKQTTASVMDALHRQPLDDLLEPLPELLAHNLAREEVRAGVLEEVRAILEIEGARTVRELLDEAGAVEAWRSEVLDVATPLVQELSRTPAFRAWLAART